MHEGKVLRKLVHDDDRKTQDIAAMIGISRPYLYKLYNQATLDPKYKKSFGDIGIVIENPELTKVNTKKVLKGDENHTGKYLPSNRYPIVNGKALTMATMISMSIADLMVLQKAQEDVETVKAIQEVITHKQTLEALQRENSLLKEIIEIQKDSLRSHKRKK